MFNYVEAEGCVLNLGEFISLQSKELHIYVCGLKPMIAAVIKYCNKHCYLDECIHWENNLLQQFLKMEMLLQLYLPSLINK